MTNDLDAYLRVTRQIHIQVLQRLLRTREDTGLVRCEVQVPNDKHFTFLNRVQSDIERVADVGNSHIQGVVTHLSNMQAVFRAIFEHLPRRPAGRIGSQTVSRLFCAALADHHRCRNRHTGLLVSYAYAEERTRSQSDSDIFRAAYFHDFELLLCVVIAVRFSLGNKRTNSMFLAESLRADLFLTHSNLTALCASRLNECFVNRLVGRCVDYAVDSIRRGWRNRPCFLARYLKLDGEFGTYQQVVQFRITAPCQQCVAVLYQLAALRKLYG